MTKNNVSCTLLSQVLYSGEKNFFGLLKTIRNALAHGRETHGGNVEIRQSLIPVQPRYLEN